jgi:hypothetical protein
MATLLEQAIQALRQLPHDEQNVAAAAVIDYAHRDEELELSSDDAAEVRRRMRTPDRVLLSLEDVRTRLHFEA